MGLLMFLALRRALPFARPSLFSLVTTMPYATESKGEADTLDYRLFFKQNGKRVSPWHDIPLVANPKAQTFHMVVEIGKGTQAKLEISTAEEGNPIKQDVKKDKLRYIADVNGFQGYPVNYGAFPQTWEDPSHTHPDTNCKGDNDPLDVCEISSLAGAAGDIKEVKVLGCLAMIDEGETDWKVICIDVNDALAKDLNDIADVETKMPGFMTKLHDWFRDYKIPDGKPPNNFAFGGEAKDRNYTLAVVQECHDLWRNQYYKVGTVPEGKDGTTDYRLFFEWQRDETKVRVSPWHGIPLVHNFLKGTFNMLVEIPKNTNAKMEVCKEEDLNPIKQDIKKGELRFVADVNGEKGYPFNYGAFPLTWEDPDVVVEETGFKGDDDPLDVCEVGSQQLERGSIVPVKVLGCLALIDEGEQDWKVLTLALSDPLADKVDSIEDLEKESPGTVKKIHDWFRDYKIPDGKPANQFAFEGQCKDRAYTLDVIQENFEAWKRKFY